LLGKAPSYSSVYRYMKSEGMFKQRRINTRHTAGTLAAEQRLQSREVRSYEVENVHGLWHLDYHHGSRKIMTKEGHYITPMLLAIMDDHSRVICHAQWYLDETAQSLAHGFARCEDEPKSLAITAGTRLVVVITKAKISLTD